MKKIFFLLVIIALVVSGVVLVRADDGQPQETTDDTLQKPAPDDPIWTEFTVQDSVAVPPIPKVDYWVVGWNDARTIFYLETVNPDGVPYGDCVIKKIRTHCIDPTLKAPYYHQVYGVTENGWLSSGESGYQRLVFEEIRIQTCTYKVYLPLVPNEEQPSNPPCCTECVAKHYKNGNLIGTVKFANTTSGGSIPTLKTINLTSPDKIRSDIVCPGGNCPNLTVRIDNGKDISTRFADCSGQIGCVDINYATYPVGITYTYYEYGCRCQSRISVVDP